MLNMKKLLTKMAEAIATIPTALSQLTEDTTHRTVTDTEKTTWNNKIDEEADFFITKEYPYSYSNLNAGSGLNISATQLGFLRPTGYVPIAVLRMTSGSVNVSVIGVNILATGSISAMVLYNHSSAARSYTASITILYAKSSLVTAQ